MAKRERRAHEMVHVGATGRTIKRRLAWGYSVVIVALVGSMAAFGLAHRGQIVGLLGLALLAVLLSIPVVVEATVHPRHLSGPGKDPRQGWGP